MTNEQKFLGYLDALKVGKNQKLIECVQEGFKTLVEYQVVGNMTERSTDLMEGEDDVPSGVPKEVVQLIQKLTEEIEELKSAMQNIDDIADEYDNEEYDEAEDFVSDDSEEEVDEERGAVEEGMVVAPDGVKIYTSAEGQEAANRAYEKSSKKEELGGIKYEKRPGSIPDMDPRDYDSIETGQRLGKVETCGKPHRDGIGENIMPTNVRKGEAAGTEVDEESEGSIANEQLREISEQSERLAGTFGSDEELKAWVQSKISKAQETIDSLYEFFKEEKGLDGDEDEEITVDEQPIFEK